MEEVFEKRISRRREAFIVHKLGAFGATLSCLSYFFETQWHTPAVGLTETAKEMVLNRVGFTLHALGRLTEAVEPLQTAIEMSVAQDNWIEAAISTINLSQLFLASGQVDKGVDYAEKGVGYADKSGDGFKIMASRAAYAVALHQAGRFDEAERLFHKAEEMKEKGQPQFPRLYSLQGFLYCDLLLEKENYQDVLERARQTLELASKENWLLDIALDNLSLGRGHLLKILKDGGMDYSEAEKHLNKAVEGLRKAGQQDELPRGLLVRSELFRIQKAFTEAHHDLDEAMTIAIRSGMGLREADCHLEYTRLYLAESDKEKAREHYTKAKAMINGMGYHRRDKDMKEIEALLE